MTNGADVLCDALLANGVDTWFANPGTSEMHLVAALDRRPEIRCVLGLSEGVVTGAADGYARMARKPAANLLHCGPGLANGLANLHNARRAHTPVVNIIGDHASYHLPYDAPLTSDIESLARPMSQWVGRSSDPQTMAKDVSAACSAAINGPGVASLILPADMAWGEAENIPAEPAGLNLRAPDPERIAAAATALKSGRKVMFVLSGDTLLEEGLCLAAGICAATGARMTAAVSNGRVERGHTLPPIDIIPYPADMALQMLSDIEVMICIGATVPVSFFAYPGKPSTLAPAGCEIIQAGSFGEDLVAVLQLLADAVGATPCSDFAPVELPPEPVPGPLTGEAIAAGLARLLPENAIVCEESITSAREFWNYSKGSARHSLLQLTGGAIGIGIPLATGAAIACPDRKVVCLQADGSGMYTCQGLWTQARERLDVVTIILSNRSYAVLHREMRNVGITEPGPNARRMLDLDEPALDWVNIARGMGMNGKRVDTAEDFTQTLQAALDRPGPYLIEAVI